MVKHKKTKIVSRGGESHRLGVLLEHVDDKVSLVVEQYGDIKKTLNLHTEILQSHTEILHNHSELLKSHREIISEMKEDMEVMKQDIQFIKGGFKKKIDVEEFSALERRVLLLEKRR